MKIIEAMKEIKDLNVKVDDLKKKIHTYCAINSHETEVYEGRQKDQVKEWIQSAHDSIKEILRLRVAIQRTNLATNVAIKLGGQEVTKSIAEWVHRKRDLADLDFSIWNKVGDRGLKEGKISESTGVSIDVKIKRFYDPVERDNKLELYRSEPSIIDRTLEITNATTDLIEV